MKSFFKFLAVFLGIVTVLGIIGWLGLGFFLSPQSDLEKSDAIVAVSGGETSSRTEEAIRLYQEGWAPMLIFSGAALDPNSLSNAEAMRRQALAAGVPGRNIIIEEASANTFQNAQGVAEIVRKSGYTKIILVTSPYHQRRAYMSFKAALPREIRILNHSATDENWRRSQWWANQYSYDLTISELQKTLFVIWAGPRKER